MAVRRVADEADPPVAERQQVLGGQPAAHHVVGDRLRNAGSQHADRHQGHPGAPEGLQLLPRQA
jgi:hypothetical protein